MSEIISRSQATLSQSKTHRYQDAANGSTNIPAACNTPSTSSFVSSATTKRPNAVATPSASLSVVVSQATAAGAVAVEASQSIPRALTTPSAAVASQAIQSKQNERVLASEPQIRHEESEDTAVPPSTKPNVLTTAVKRSTAVNDVTARSEAVFNNKTAPLGGGDTLLAKSESVGRARDPAQMSEFLSKVFDKNAMAGRRPKSLLLPSDEEILASQSGTASSQQPKRAINVNQTSTTNLEKSSPSTVDVKEDRQYIAQPRVVLLAEQSIVPKTDDGVNATTLTKKATEPGDQEAKVLFVYVETECDAYDARPRIFKAVRATHNHDSREDDASEPYYELIPMQIEAFDEEQIAYQNKKPIRRVLRGLRLEPIEFARTLGMRRLSSYEGRLEEWKSSENKEDGAIATSSQPIHGAARIVSSIEQLERCLFYEAGDRKSVV